VHSWSCRGRAWANRLTRRESVQQRV